MSKGHLVTAGLSALAPNYDAVFCDIWGVLHNGVKPHPGAVVALERFREAGGRVVLVTNASRPAPQIAEMLANMSVGDTVYDRIVTSGDVTRELVRPYSGRIIHFVGPHADHPMLKGLGVGQGAPDESAAVVVTGLDESGQRPEDYSDRFKAWLSHRLPLICANPDKVVEIGDKIEYCAGALADVYAGMGGHVEMAGKPYPPIYEAGFHALEEITGTPPVHGRILAIGDSVRTDALGAGKFGIDFLFITGSLHAEELEAFAGADEDRVIEMVAPSRASLVGYMPRLVW